MSYVFVDDVLLQSAVDAFQSKDNISQNPKFNCGGSPQVPGACIVGSVKDATDFCNAYSTCVGFLCNPPKESSTLCIPLSRAVLVDNKAPIPQFAYLKRNVVATIYNTVTTIGFTPPPTPTEQPTTPSTPQPPIQTQDPGNPSDSNNPGSTSSMETSTASTSTISSNPSNLSFTTETGPITVGPAPTSKSQTATQTAVPGGGLSSSSIDSPQSSNSTPIIIGVVVGVLLVIIAAIVLIILYRRKKKAAIELEQKMVVPASHQSTSPSDSFNQSSSSGVKLQHFGEVGNTQNGNAYGGYGANIPMETATPLPVPVPIPASVHQQQQQYIQSQYLNPSYIDPYANTQQTTTYQPQYFTQPSQYPPVPTKSDEGGLYSNLGNSSNVQMFPQKNDPAINPHSAEKVAYMPEMVDTSAPAAGSSGTGLPAYIPNEGYAEAGRRMEAKAEYVPHY
ncbi:hypothetical protein HDU97_006140 [Phlyctochytrium planicorne]|nr:hypothetical protein HDU97_006140 [Phlyctochytrium planicorne]